MIENMLDTTTRKNKHHHDPPCQLPGPSDDDNDADGDENDADNDVILTQERTNLGKGSGAVLSQQQTG